MRAGQAVGGIVGNEETISRQIDRGLQQLGKREFSRAIFFECQRQARRRAGNADAERGIARFGGIWLAVGTKEDVGCDRTGCGLAIVDRHVFVALRQMDDHESAAAKIARAG